jgi:hypothetical protein
MKVSKAFRESPYHEQLRKLQSLQQARSVPELQCSVQETGIRWYVIHPGDSYAWPPQFRDRPIFESNGYKVYDMQRCFDLSGQAGSGLLQMVVIDNQGRCRPVCSSAPGLLLGVDEIVNGNLSWTVLTNRR